ncbi:hypothetical protein BKA69DRAFT_1078297 [Paraphysoderma sedebokerense]|nr:hypothetical protein BKA69DRAFT_1078297 [Paraphysoderma sedebokerense]
MSPGVLLHCVRQFRFVKFFHHTLSASTTLLKNLQPSLVRELLSNSKPIFKLLRISPTSTPIASTLSTLRFHFQSNTRPPLFLHSIKMVQHRTISSSSSSSSSSTSSASTFNSDSTVTEFNVKLPPSLQFRNDASVLETCRKWWTHFTKGRGLEEQFTGRTLGTVGEVF